MTMDGKTFCLVHIEAARGAIKFVKDVVAAEGFVGWTVRIFPPVKRRIQEEKYHAMIGDIAAQTTYAGKRWDSDDMKRILVDEFADEMRNAGSPLRNDTRIIPSENGRRIIQLGIQTREFTIGEAAQFIEFLYAWGADRDVMWSDVTKQLEYKARSKKKDEVKA